MVWAVMIRQTGLGLKDYVSRIECFIFLSDFSILFVFILYILFAWMLSSCRVLDARQEEYNNRPSCLSIFSQIGVQIHPEEHDMHLVYLIIIIYIRLFGEAINLCI